MQENLEKCQFIIVRFIFLFYFRDSDKDEFLVLACDGVWDVMTNEDICSFVSARMHVTDNLEQIANEVIDTCLHKVRKFNINSGKL